jgi:hypothetical protein
MKVESLRLLRGPNVHAARPRAVARLDLESLEGQPLAPLRQSLEGMGGETSVAGIVGRLAVKLQALAGAPVEAKGDRRRRRQRSATT